jgi:uncharacterized protein (DUF58 family)
VLRLVRELLTFKPEGRGTRIDEALRFLGRVFRRKAVVFLLTDLQAAGFERQLAASRRRHDVSVIQTTDARETTLPAAGLLTLRDPETGQLTVVDTGSPRVRENFAQRASLERARGKELLRRLKVDTLPLMTGKPYLQALKTFFRLRGKRAAR